MKNQLENRAVAPAASPYNVEDLASRLGISRISLYEAIRRGEVPHIRIGRRIVLPREAIDRWLACRRDHGRP